VFSRRPYLGGVVCTCTYVRGVLWFQASDAVNYLLNLNQTTVMSRKSEKSMILRVSQVFGKLPFLKGKDFNFSKISCSQLFQ
jgi:hypothetical protein